MDGYGRRAQLAMLAWQVGSLATFIYLLLFDGYRYTLLNWPIAIAADVLLSAIWPIYWAILRPLIGH